MSAFARDTRGVRGRRKRALVRRRREAEAHDAALRRAVEDGYPGKIRNLTCKRDLARAEVETLEGRVR